MSKAISWNAALNKLYHMSKGATLKTLPMIERYGELVAQRSNSAAGQAQALAMIARAQSKVAVAYAAGAEQR